MALQEELEQQGNYLFKYRGSLPILLLLGSLVVFAYMQYNSLGYEKYIPYEFVEYFGLAIAFLGLLIRIFTVGYSAKNTSGRNTSEGQVADELNSTGIYSMVRHPLYVGNLLMWLGPAVLVQNVWFVAAFVLTYWVYYERIMFAEEQFLRRKFGDVYLDWASGVPAFVLSFKNYISPKEKFSWKKAIKKEKNGLAAIFVIFFIFKLIKEYIVNGTYALDTWEFYAMIISLVLYFILKILKKRTNIFEDGR